MPRPTSSSTVCSASARPRISGSFTFSSTALHQVEPQGRLGFQWVMTLHRLPDDCEQNKATFSSTALHKDEPQGRLARTRR